MQSKEPKALHEEDKVAIIEYVQKKRLRNCTDVTGRFVNIQSNRITNWRALSFSVWLFFDISLNVANDFNTAAVRRSVLTVQQGNSRCS